MTRARGPFTLASKKERVLHHHVELDDGRIVALFVNRDTNLVVLDIADADEKGGCEVYRRRV